jgi:3-hydroxyisobutyrate dehydrogenase-like beta-hydroxyacid dehydrogenase
MRIGFIGTGTMGQPMLANLVRKGFQAIVYDTAPAGLDAAVGLGAERAASAAEAVTAGDLVITMLPSSANVEAVYLGKGGVLEAAPSGRLCVDMSTIDPSTSQRVAARLRERGLRFLDAPVSGGVGGAAAITVGGDVGDLEEARPALWRTPRRAGNMPPAS